MSASACRLTPHDPGQRPGGDAVDRPVLGEGVWGLTGYGVLDRRRESGAGRRTRRHRDDDLVVGLSTSLHSSLMRWQA